MSKFKIECPYCYKNNEYDFKICKQYSNYRTVKCEKCNLKFKIFIACNIERIADKEELKNIIPKDKIDMVKKVCSKYFDYRCKGGYESSRNIIIAKDVEEKIVNWNNENCYCISLSGKANYYQNEYRTVYFYIYPSGNIEQEVHSQYTHKESFWFRGDTIEDKIDNYIKQALIKWENI